MFWPVVWLAVAAVAVLVPWNLAAHAAGDGDWGSRHDDRLLAQNPHLVLFGSVARGSSAETSSP